MISPVGIDELNKLHVGAGWNEGGLFNLAGAMRGVCIIYLSLIHDLTINREIFILFYYLQFFSEVHIINKVYR